MRHLETTVHTLGFVSQSQATPSKFCVVKGCTTVRSLKAKVLKKAYQLGINSARSKVKMSSPQVVRELQRASAMKRDWRSGLGVFAYVLTFSAGVYGVLFAFPEKDAKGRDHVFSGIQRFYKRKRNEFFGVYGDRKESADRRSVPTTAPAKPASVS